MIQHNTCGSWACLAEHLAYKRLILQPKQKCKIVLLDLKPLHASTARRSLTQQRRTCTFPWSPILTRPAIEHMLTERHIEVFSTRTIPQLNDDDLSVRPRCTFGLTPKMRMSRRTERHRALLASRLPRMPSDRRRGPRREAFQGPGLGTLAMSSRWHRQRVRPNHGRAPGRRRLPHPCASSASSWMNRRRARAGAWFLTRAKAIGSRPVASHCR